MISGRRGKLLAACLAVLLVPGCSEDDSSTPLPTPTPSPSPSPSPSPTPSASPTSEPAPGTSYPPGCAGADAIASPGFPLAQTGMRYDVGTPAVFFNPQASDTLHRQNDRFTFFARDNLVDSKIDESTSFGPAEISADLSTADMITYKRDCPYLGLDKTSYTSFLSLSRPGSSNPLITLNYVGYGSFEFNKNQITLSYTDFRPFGYVLSNPASGNSQSGTFVYRGLVIGDGAEGPFSANKHYSITGSAEITVDFTAKTFTAILDLTGKRSANSGGGSYAFGKITYTQSNADFAQLNGTRDRGKLLGLFGGPAAEEMALVATLTMQNPDDPNGGDVSFALAGAAKR